MYTSINIRNVRRVLLVFISVKRFFSTSTLNVFIYVCLSHTNLFSYHSRLLEILIVIRFYCQKNLCCLEKSIVILRVFYFSRKAYLRRSVSSFAQKKISLTRNVFREFSKLKFFRACVRQTSLH